MADERTPSRPCALHHCHVEFTLYVDWYAPEGLTEPAIEALAEFRPSDGSLCLWTDTPLSQLVHLSLDVNAADFDSAGRLALEVGTAMASMGHLGGRLVNVTAITEEASQEWHGEESLLRGDG
jgi:hypothetical protein